MVAESGWTSPIMEHEGDLTPSEVERSLAWIADNPNPLAAALPPEIRAIWLRAAESVLASPMGSEVFAVYFIGRATAEFAAHPGASLWISGIDPEIADGKSDGSPPGGNDCIEMPAPEVLRDFGIWAQKLALLLVAEAATYGLTDFRLFRFSDDEIIWVDRAT